MATIQRLTTTDVPNATFSAAEAMHLGYLLGIDWTRAPFGVEQFRLGLGGELGQRIGAGPLDDEVLLSARATVGNLLICANYYACNGACEGKLCPVAAPGEVRLSGGSAGAD